jgi:hypothetical protein
VKGVKLTFQGPGPNETPAAGDALKGDEMSGKSANVEVSSIVHARVIRAPALPTRGPDSAGAPAAKHSSPLLPISRILR